MASTTILLPRNFNVSTLHEFVGSVIDPHRQPRFQHVVFDFSQLGFIEGDGLTAFVNTVEWLRSRGVQCAFLNHTRGTPALSYLDDCGLFSRYLGRPLSPSAAPRGTTLPIQCVEHSNSHQWLEFTFSQWLAPKLGTTPAALADVRTCLKEVFNNIMDHSREDSGWVHAQWYPNKERVHIAISDFGRGIPAAIAERFHCDDDGHAIELATRDGITTRSVAGNRGAGLAILTDYVVASNGGSVSIHSSRGRVSFLPGKEGVSMSQRVGNAPYPGTLLNIRFRTDRMDLGVADREDLEW
jgi:anti-sigma regulatory factor (Ser/Thr protein kinase)